MHPKYLLNDGFRPFFLGAAAVAAFHVVAWVAFLSGNAAPPAGWSPLVWHGHEMVFGFASALITGFLLTAAANWTGVRIAGPVILAGLFLVWLAPRLGLVFGGLPIVWIQVAAAAFLPLLTVVVAIPVIATRNARNYPIIAILAALSVASIVLHIAIAGVVAWPVSTLLRGAMDIILILMVVVGARIIPFFTSRRLSHLAIANSPAKAVAATSSVLAAVVVGWLAPATVFAALVAVVAAAALLLRQWQWRPLGTLGEPMLWILHLGYLWIAIALALRATPLPPSIALHALTMGALGCLAIGMMTRVALGHTGQEIRADAWMVASFLLVALAVVPRLVYPLLPFDAARGSLALAAVLWAGGFLLYLLRFLPVMLAPRR